jgi:hypothetical protein
MHLDVCLFSCGGLTSGLDGIWVKKLLLQPAFVPVVSIAVRSFGQAILHYLPMTAAQNQ